MAGNGADIKYIQAINQYGNTARLLCTPDHSVIINGNEYILGLKAGLFENSWLMTDDAVTDNILMNWSNGSNYCRVRISSLRRARFQYILKIQAYHSLPSNTGSPVQLTTTFNNVKWAQYSPMNATLGDDAKRYYRNSSYNINCTLAWHNKTGGSDPTDTFTTLVLNFEGFNYTASFNILNHHPSEGEEILVPFIFNFFSNGWENNS